MEEALVDYGLSEEEIKEKKSVEADIQFLCDVENMEIIIRMDKNGNYCEDRTAEIGDGRYHYDYESENIKKFNNLRQDKEFFKSALKYFKGKPKWSEGSQYDDWVKAPYTRNVFVLMEKFATKEVINDPEVVASV